MAVERESDDVAIKGKKAGRTAALTSPGGFLHGHGTSRYLPECECRMSDYWGWSKWPRV